jgi:hypothetical protein
VYGIAGKSAAEAIPVPIVALSATAAMISAFNQIMTAPMPYQTARAHV